MRLLYLLKKECIEIIRQRELMFLVLVVPIVEIILLGYIFASDIRNIPLQIFDLSGSQTTREIVRKISVSRIFEVRRIVRHPEDALEILKNGEAKAIVTFRDTAQGLSRGAGVPEIQILIDGSDPVSAQTAGAALNGILTEFISQEAGEGKAAQWMAAEGRDVIPPPIAAKVIVRFNPDGKAIHSQGPALAALLLTFLTFFIASLSLIREKEQQTLDALLVSRLTPLEIFVGKGLPAATIGLVNLGLGIPVLMIWFRVPFRGNAGVILAGAMIYLAAIVPLALAYSAVSSSQTQAMFLTWYTMVTFLILSGFFTPVESIPPAAVLSRAIAAVNPFRYMMRILGGVMLKGGGWSVVGEDLLILGGLALLSAAGSFIVFRRSLKP